MLAIDGADLFRTMVYHTFLETPRTEGTSGKVHGLKKDSVACDYVELTSFSVAAIVSCRKTREQTGG